MEPVCFPPALSSPALNHSSDLDLRHLTFCGATVLRMLAQVEMKEESNCSVSRLATYCNYYQTELY